MQACLAKPQVGQGDGYTKLLEEREELAACLSSKLASSKALLQAKLNQNPEAHFLAVQNPVASGELGQSVMDGVGCDCSALGSTQSADDTSGEAAGFSHAHPGITLRIVDGFFGIQQQLISQHPGHLNGLLDDPIVTGATAHRGFVPLGDGISDATCQSASRSLANQVVVKDQEIRAAAKSHIPLEGTCWGINVGERSPACAGGSTQGHGDASDPDPIRQQLAGVKHFPASRSNQAVTSLISEF